MNQETPLRRGEGEIVELVSVQPRTQRGSLFPFWVSLVEFDNELLTVEIRVDDRQKFIDAGFRSALVEFKSTTGLNIAVTLKWQPIKRRKQGGRWVIDRIMSDGGEEKSRRPEPEPVSLEEPPLDSDTRARTWACDLQLYKKYTQEGNVITLEHEAYGKIVWEKLPHGYSRLGLNKTKRFFEAKKEEAVTKAA